MEHNFHSINVNFIIIFVEVYICSSLYFFVSLSCALFSSFSMSPTYRIIQDKNIFCKVNHALSRLVLLGRCFIQVTLQAINLYARLINYCPSYIIKHGPLNGNHDGRDTAKSTVFPTQGIASYHFPQDIEPEVRTSQFLSGKIVSLLDNKCNRCWFSTCRLQ